MNSKYKLIILKRNKWIKATKKINYLKNKNKIKKIKINFSIKIWDKQ